MAKLNRFDHNRRPLINAKIQEKQEFLQDSVIISENPSKYIHNLILI